jgi:hypothetical protein
VGHSDLTGKLKGLDQPQGNIALREFVENFSLDSSHQAGNAAFTTATLRKLQHPRANTDSENSHNKQHTRVKQKKSLRYTNEHLAQPEIFSSEHRTKHDPKSMRVMPLCLWGV